MIIKILPLIFIGVLLYKLIESIYKAGYTKGLIDGRKEVKKYVQTMKL